MRQYPNHRLLSLPLLALGLVLSLAITTACSEKNDDEPQKPDTLVTPETPTNPDDWQTVPASGGTVSRGDITITFPSGTFTTETKVAVTEVTKGTVMGSDERSTFYQITLAANSGKEFTVRLKGENTDAQTLIVQRVQGLNQHTGEIETGILPMVETTVQDGEYTVSVPTLHAEDGEQPSLTIGLAEVLTSDNAAAKAPQTRASTDKGVVVSWPGVGSAEKKLIVAEAKKYAEEANRVLVAFGLQRPDRTIPYVIEPGKGWGNHIQSKLTDANNYIQLCKQNFEGLLNASETDLQELRRTVLHETFHYYFSQVYDKRWASTKTAAGLAGDEWSLLNEAFGGWIEKQVAPHEMFEEAANQGHLLMEEFFPKSLNMERSILQGYGMGLALEYFAQQKGDKALLELLNIKREESPSSLRACFDKFLSKNGMTFFDDASYYKFVEAALGGKVDKRTPYLPASGGAKNLPFNINRAGGDMRRMSLHQVVSYSAKVNNLGIYPMDIEFTDGDIVMLGTEKELRVTEEAEGVETHAYIAEFEEKNGVRVKVSLTHLGVAKKDAPLTYQGDFSMFKTNKEACFYLVSFKLNSSTYSAQTNTSIVLTYPDYIDLKPDELTFDGKAGSQTVTVETNITDITVEPSDRSWLSASYDKDAGKLTVSVTANGSEKREGTVSVKGGDVVKPLKVTQAAAVGAFDFSQVKAVKVTVQAKCKQVSNDPDDGESPREIMYKYEAWQYACNFASNWNTVVSANGQGVQIEAKCHSDLDDYSILITIDDVVNGKITNCTVKHTWDEYSNDRHDYIHHAASATNIPLPSSSGRTKGNSATGTTVTNLSQNYHYAWKDLTRTFIGSDDDEVTIEFLTSSQLYD